MSGLEDLKTLSPFNNWLKLDIEIIESGFAKIHIPWSDDLIGDPSRPVIHGGVLSSLIDATGGAACMSLLENEDKISTINLQVDFLEPGSPGEFYCEGRVMRAGKRVAIARMEVYAAGDKPKLIAIGSGTYNLLRS
ncbi:MAG: hotdog fold thioesterase [Deltaproteobacteria bacterium]|nr:hotdog fold thioesterase [Deltaproteobacteria bacterium]